jgi:hypothetical protein
MEDKKKSVIESYRKELEEIHPSLPAYFYATTGYIMPWNSQRNVDDRIHQFLLEPIDPNGEIDEAVLDELIRMWVQESWFGLAVHPPLAFMLLRRHLKDPKSKLSQLLYKDGLPKEVVKQGDSVPKGEEVVLNFVEMQFEKEEKAATKTRSRRKT